MKKLALSMMLSAAIAVAALGVPRLTEAAQEGNRVTFEVTDEPGRWFKNTAGPIAGTQSLAVIQPGGSVRDDEVIRAADEHGVAMVFTGIRHFRH